MSLHQLPLTYLGVLADELAASVMATQWRWLGSEARPAAKKVTLQTAGIFKRASRCFSFVEHNLPLCHRSSFVNELAPLH